MIIGLGSKSNVGKDHAALYMQKSLNALTKQPVVIIKFADALKEIVSLISGIPIRELENPTIKNMYLPLFNKTVRQILVEVGTDLFRTWDENIWIKTLQIKYNFDNSDMIYIISDVRFPNELEWINSLDFGYTIRINRALAPIINHPSETALDDYVKKFTWVIDNNSSIDSFEYELEQICQVLYAYGEF